MKAMHSSLRFAFLIKELCAQSRYFSNTPRTNTMDQIKRMNDYKQLDANLSQKSTT